MIAVVVHHYVFAHQLEEADMRIRETGSKMCSFSGFVSRLALRSQSEPLKIITVTCWEGNENREAWDQSSERRQAVEGTAHFWSKPPEAELFDVIPEL